MRQKVVTTGVFSDGVHGSELAALNAAREYRDQLLNALYDPSYRLWRRSVELKNNTSGHPGVGRHTIRKKKKNGLIETHYWVAYWTDADGRIKSRRFSIKKYGEVKAKALACAARVEALAQLVG